MAVGGGPLKPDFGLSGDFDLPMSRWHGRTRAFRRFVSLGLTVMTQSYALDRHDVVFPQEHCGHRPHLQPAITTKERRANNWTMVSQYPSIS